MKRLKPEHIAALVAILATAYVGIHKLYKETQVFQSDPELIGVVKHGGPPPGRENLVIRTFPVSEKALRRATRPTPRRGWPCAYQVILGELVIVGTVLVVVLLTSR